ncbi:MAG: DUF4197 domain-containing protein [bacterium]
MRKNRMILQAGCILLLLPILACGCAEIQGDSLDAILRSAKGVMDSPLDQETVAAGLKEALRIGTTRSVDVTSRVDGYLANALIRIALPDQLRPMTRSLRSIGLDSQVDALETAMNRAAEKAAGEAREVFWDAITQMTLADAFGILRGKDTAATDYLREHTGEMLRSRFQPIVTAKMGEVGFYRIYENLANRYNTLPFVTKPAIDLNAYVTERALDGLFTILGQEEKRIREDPTARTTDLLRRVFGR